jgi:hypothetical protein
LVSIIKTAFFFATHAACPHRADIEHAKVASAPDLSLECTRKFFGELGRRRIWLIEPDTNPTELNGNARTWARPDDIKYDERLHKAWFEKLDTYPRLPINEENQRARADDL